MYPMTEDESGKGFRKARAFGQKIVLHIEHPYHRLSARGSLCHQHGWNQTEIDSRRGLLLPAYPGESIGLDEP